MITRLRAKGQITIPANIRTSLKLRVDSVLSVAKVGNAILLSPQESIYEDVAKKIAKAAKKESISLNGLLKELKSARKNK
ncbi:MAG: bifunctional DNA-binding transcriptional regulator [Candidatus Omnitrophota bacterium]|jgi:bifunctional DNA-binding transcriptional regulator/antitoxin component of YhaV-PrlF toxin-antitoxin module